jgi:hypothetical protein
MHTLAELMAKWEAEQDNLTVDKIARAEVS